MNSQSDDNVISSSNGEAHMYQQMRGNSQTESTDSSDNDVRDRKRRYKKMRGLDKSKSSSMHELAHPDEHEMGRLVKAHSQEILVDSNEDVMTSNDVIRSQEVRRQYSQPSQSIQSRDSGFPASPAEVKTPEEQSKVIYVRSSSENDSLESNQYQPHSVGNGVPPPKPKRTMLTEADKQHSKSSSQLYATRYYDSDSSSPSEYHAMEFQRQNAGRHMGRSASRDESLNTSTVSTTSSHLHMNRGHHSLNSAVSESYLQTVCISIYKC